MTTKQKALFRQFLIDQYAYEKHWGMTQSRLDLNQEAQAGRFADRIMDKMEYFERFEIDEKNKQNI